MGLWLPLALADFFALALRIHGRRSDKPVRRSAVLRSWALPVLADALARDEAAADERELEDNFAALAARFGSKEE